MADLCPHDGDPTTCPPCQRAAEQGHGPAVPTRGPRLVLFRARFVSRCTRCPASILIDDEIGRDGDDGYAHRECLEADL